MTRDAVLVEVEDRHGPIRLRLDALTDAEEQACREIIAPLGLTEMEGLYVAALLARQIADAEAYERECARRGLMPL